MNNSHLYLTGFMGAGKTTVGRILSQQLSAPFIDTDERIQEIAGKSVLDIFKRDGEAFFRRIESQVIKETASKSAAVVALGGGAVIVPSNWRTIVNSGRVVYLRWEIEILLKRISQDVSRPLLALLNLSGLRELFEIRKPLYEQAQFICGCEDTHTPNWIANKIITLIG